MAKRARKVRVDMTGVESYTRCPEGEWLAKLVKIEEVTIQGSGDDGLKAQFEVLKGDAKGCKVFETFSLGEKALWKLKSFLDATGMKSDGKLMLDLDKLEGKTCILDVVHDEYNGQKRAKISAYIKPGADSDDDDDLEDELDNDELDEEEEKPAKKSSAKKPAKKVPAKKKPEPDDDDEDWDDDEDEDEEEPPKPAKKAKKPAPKKPAKKAKKQPEPEPEDDDDDDWEEDDD